MSGAVPDESILPTDQLSSVSLSSNVIGDCQDSLLRLRLQRFWSQLHYLHMSIVLCYYATSESKGPKHSFISCSRLLGKQHRKPPGQGTVLLLLCSPKCASTPSGEIWSCCCPELQFLWTLFFADGPYGNHLLGKQCP